MTASNLRLRLCGDTEKIIENMRSLGVAKDRAREIEARRTKCRLEI